MALRTATQNGSFTTGSTWVGGVAPSGTDTFEIPTGITVTLATGSIAFSTGGVGISGTLSFSGSTALNGGTQNINAGGTIAFSSGTLGGGIQNVNSGGTLSLSGTATLATNGVLTVNSGGALSLTGSALFLDGEGGTVDINSGGTIALSASATIQGGPLGGALNIHSGGTISFSGSASAASVDAGDGDGSVLAPSIVLASGAIFKNTTGLSQLVQLTDSSGSGGAASLNNAILFSRGKFTGNNAIFG